jgi:hypothetical protein
MYQAKVRVGAKCVNMTDGLERIQTGIEGQDREAGKGESGIEGEVGLNNASEIWWPVPRA